MLVPRDLPGHEEEPCGLHARHPAIHDHEVVVGQLRDKRREDLFEALAPVEAGMVHAVPHHRMEIDELRLEGGELGCELRHRLLHFPNAGLFERRTSPHCLDGVPAKAIARLTSKSDVTTAC